MKHSPHPHAKYRTERLGTSSSLNEDRPGQVPSRAPSLKKQQCKTFGWLERHADPCVTGTPADLERIVEAFDQYSNGQG